jgi:hypothetical protein
MIRPVAQAREDLVIQRSVACASLLARRHSCHALLARAGQCEQTLAKPSPRERYRVRGPLLDVGGSFVRRLSFAPLLLFRQEVFPCLQSDQERDFLWLVVVLLVVHRLTIGQPREGSSLRSRLDAVDVP